MSSSTPSITMVGSAYSDTFGRARATRHLRGWSPDIRAAAPRWQAPPSRAGRGGRLPSRGAGPACSRGGPSSSLQMARIARVLSMPASATPGAVRMARWAARGSAIGSIATHRSVARSAICSLNRAPGHSLQS